MPQDIGALGIENQNASDVVRLTPPDLGLEAAIQDLDATAKGLDAGPLKLPGLTITKYVLHDLQEPAFQRMAEPYLFGIAVDSQLKPMEIPLVKLDPEKFAPAKVVKGEEVTFGDEYGGALCLPPIHDFLAVVLMVADSDNARSTASVLKAVAGAATNKDLILLAGMVTPPAGVILAAVGAALEAAVKIVEGNRDDIIAVFSVYYPPSRLTPGTAHRLTTKGADVWFRVMDE